MNPSQSEQVAAKILPQLDIRTATDSDQDTLFSLHEELFREDIDRIWGWDDQWQSENFRNEWQEVDTATIYEADRLVGYIQTRDEQDHVYVLNLAIYPRYQNRGIGSEIIEQLKSRNTTLRLGVFRTNDKALALYLRNGFRVTEETETGFKLQWEPNPPGPLPEEN